ncbi:MAG: PQQ-like beta-propeller repeat protein [Spirochaetes bacterium]|nr:PQQ-like beta-propeller repeat protein [Spirochaetota bacterium]
MRRNQNIQSFELNEALLRFDLETSILLCQSPVNGKKVWVKKLNGLVVSDIFEDNKRYYIVCDSGEINGQFLAVKKENGTTSWFIPGKSFMHVLYKGFLFLIFADENNHFYLLKVYVNTGKSAWFHPVDQDLNEYIFMNEKLQLKYFSGKNEKLSIKTGKLIN